MLHIIHAPELLSFAGIFYHQHEAGGDSAQIDVAKLTESGRLATLVDYLPNEIAYLFAHTARLRVFLRGKPTLG